MILQTVWRAAQKNSWGGLHQPSPLHWRGLRYLSVPAGKEGIFIIQVLFNVHRRMQLCVTKLILSSRNHYHAIRCLCLLQFVVRTTCLRSTPTRSTAAGSTAVSTESPISSHVASRVVQCLTQRQAANSGSWRGEMPLCGHAAEIS